MNILIVSMSFVFYYTQMKEKCINHYDKNYKTLIFQILISLKCFYSIVVYIASGGLWYNMQITEYLIIKD